jgi:hypothetical protein
VKETVIKDYMFYTSIDMKCPESILVVVTEAWRDWGKNEKDS